MTKEGQEIFTKEDKPGKTREGEKTSRFRHSDTSEKCAPPYIEQMQQNPMDMVKSLVSQLPGLDRDTVYVISGPFPNYDPAHGHSQLIMATPISPGVTVVAVPSVPPSCTPFPPVPGNIHVNQKTACSHVDKTRMNTRTPQPPHMLHWDTHHPVGQTMPLRQPNPPVYYNVPSNTSSGLQSPASDGSYLSDNSSTMYDTSSTYRDQKNVIHNYGYVPISLTWWDILNRDIDNTTALTIKYQCLASRHVGDIDIGCSKVYYLSFHLGGGTRKPRKSFLILELFD